MDVGNATLYTLLIADDEVVTAPDVDDAYYGTQ